MQQIYKQNFKQYVTNYFHLSLRTFYVYRQLWSHAGVIIFFLNNEACLQFHVLKIWLIFFQFLAVMKPDTTASELQALMKNLLVQRINEIGHLNVAISKIQKPNMPENASFFCCAIVVVSVAVSNSVEINYHRDKDSPF